jgi:hypothetical protein
MTSPLLGPRDFDALSVSQRAALLRGARRQKGLPDIPVPRACLLDPEWRHHR